MHIVECMQDGGGEGGGGRLPVEHGSFNSFVTGKKFKIFQKSSIFGELLQQKFRSIDLVA